MTVFANLRDQTNQLLKRSLSARIALRLGYLWLFSVGLAMVAHAEQTHQSIVLLLIGVVWALIIWRTCSWRWATTVLMAMLLLVVTAISVWPLSETAAYNLSLRAGNQAWYTWLTAPWIHRDLRHLTYVCTALLVSVSIFGWLRTSWSCVALVVLFAGIGDVLSATISGYASLGLSGVAAGLLVAAITQSIPGSRDQLKRFGATWLYTVFAVATWSVCLPNLYLTTDVSAQMYVGGTIGGLVASIGWTWWSRIRSRPEEYESLLLVNKL